MFRIIFFQCFPSRSVITHNYVSLNNTTLYCIYNKNCILSGRHVSTFIRSSSGSLEKRSKIYISMHWNINSFWICFFPRGPEDGLIKVEMSPWQNILFLLYIKFLWRKMLGAPSFGGEVKPSVPCRRFAACKRSLNWRGSEVTEVNGAGVLGVFLYQQESMFAVLLIQVKGNYKL